MLRLLIKISFVTNTCINKFGPTLSLTCLEVTVYLHVELRRVEGRPSNMEPSCCCVFLSANTRTYWHPLVFALAEGTCYWVNYHSDGKQCFYEGM